MKLLFSLLAGIATGTVACEAPVDDDMTEPTELAMYLQVSMDHLPSLRAALRSFALQRNLQPSVDREEAKAPKGTFVTGYETSFEDMGNGKMSRAIYLHNNVRTECVRVLVRAWDDCQTQEAQKLVTGIRVHLRDLLGSGTIKETSQQLCDVTP